MATNKTLSAKNRGVRTGKVEFIVLHDTAGSGTDGDPKYLANDPENRKISVDYCVTKDGTVWELNHDLSGHCTFHAGRHTSFRGRVNGAVNQHSVGIEISQKADMRGLNPAYPEIQVVAVAFLCRDLCSRFNLTKEDITTHAHIITDGSRSDPRNFPWDAFWAYFAGVDAPAIPEVDGRPKVVYHTVVVGDTLSGLANTYKTTIEQLKARNGMNTPSNVIKVGQRLIVG